MLECPTSRAHQQQRYGAARLMEVLRNERRLAHPSVLVRHASGIPSWQDRNALTIKPAPPSDDDLNYGTFGSL